MPTEPDTASLRQRVLADPTIPEPVRRALEKGARLESIRLDGQGGWWHAGARIDHPRIGELFSRSVDLTEGGTYVLRIGPFTYPIEVEDTPYWVSRARIDDGASVVLATLNDGSQERLAPEVLAYQGPGRLLAQVKGGRLPARFSRQAYHDLLDHLEEAEGGYVLAVGERRLFFFEPAA